MTATPTLAMTVPASPVLCVSQRFFFDAAHTLQRQIEAEGSRRIHGHTYHAEVTLRGPLDPATGMVIDLGYLRLRLQSVREQLDHPVRGKPRGSARGRERGRRSRPQGRLCSGAQLRSLWICIH